MSILVRLLFTFKTPFIDHVELTIFIIRASRVLSPQLILDETKPKIKNHYGFS